MAAIFVPGITGPASAADPELEPLTNTDPLPDPSTLPNACDTFTCIFPTLPGADVSLVETPDIPDAVLDNVEGPALLGGGVSVGPEDLAPNNKSCYFYETSYARGGRGEGDDAYFAVDTALGARAAAHTVSGGTAITTRHSEAWASAGVKFTYKGRSNSAAVVFPWKALGEMSTQIQQYPSTSSRAEAETNVKLVLRDLTTGTTLGSIDPVAHWYQEGQALNQRQAQGRRSISFTLQGKHKYAAFIRVDTRAESDTPHPFLAADSRNDFLYGPRRASLDWVKVEAYTYPVTCS